MGRSSEYTGATASCCNRRDSSAPPPPSMQSGNKAWPPPGASRALGRAQTVAEILHDEDPVTDDRPDDPRGLRGGHFGRDDIGRRQVDVAHHVLRRRRHSKKTEAKRCGPEGAFHRQLRQRRILARDHIADYETSRSVRSPLIRRAMSALIAAISASPRALRGVRIGRSARTRAGRGDSRNKRSPRRTASSTSWVTSSVVTERLSTNVAIWSRRRAARACVKRRKRFVEDEEIRLNRECSGERDAPGEAER